MKKNFNLMQIANEFPRKIFQQSTIYFTHILILINATAREGDVMKVAHNKPM